MKHLLILLPLLVLSTHFMGCNYQDDFSFISDARAGKFSEEVFINNKLCQDILGQVGACTIQIPNTLPLSIAISERPYEYRINVVCSDKIAFPTHSAQVLEMTKYNLSIPFPTTETSFTCQGEIFPLDRTEAVSTQFEVRAKVYNSSLIPLDIPRVEGNRAIVGQYALHTRVCSGTFCQWVNKKPYFKPKSKEGPYSLRAESASGRISYGND